MTGRLRFQGISQLHIAEIVWEIFSDARAFFSATMVPNGPLPQSSLSVARGLLSSGTIKGQSFAPMKELLGLSSATTLYPSPAGEGGAMSALSPPAQRPQPPFRPRVNTAHLAAIKALVAPLLARFPALKAVQLMQSTTPPISAKDLNFTTGQCVEFHVLGVCQNPKCRYKHDVQSTQMAAGKVTKTVGLLSNAIQNYQPS
jgi:hypothetical protein